MCNTAELKAAANKITNRGERKRALDVVESLEAGKASKQEIAWLNQHTLGIRQAAGKSLRMRAAEKSQQHTARA